MSERNPPSSSFGGLKDFSVDAQRRMFVEQQERERQADENKRTTRKIKQAMGGGTPTGVELSGLMSRIDEDDGTARKRVVVGDDDDDSIADDDWSLDSEESFYVGIARADYAQPDNMDMYGEEKEEGGLMREDRFGISRVSVAMMNRENYTVPIHDESTSRSLYEFMNGPSGNRSRAKNDRAKRDQFVAMPIVGSGIDWKEENKLGEDDTAAIEQVYEHKAAEGKMFIDKIVNASRETPGKDGASTVGEMSCPPTTPGFLATAPGIMAPGSTPGYKSGEGRVGHYPVLSPMALFSPGITTAVGAKIVEGEDNGLRQMREREIRKEANVNAVQKMKDFKKVMLANKDRTGKVDAFEMMQMLEQIMEK